MSILIPLVYLTTVFGVATLLLKWSYLLFVRFAFAPVGLAIATVIHLLNDSYPNLATAVTVGVAAGALLFLVIQVFLVVMNLSDLSLRRGSKQKVALDSTST